MPFACEVTYMVILYWLTHRERLLPDVYVRSQDKDSDGDRVRVGDFDSDGFNVGNYWDDLRGEGLGLASSVPPRKPELCLWKSYASRNLEALATSEGFFLCFTSRYHARDRYVYLSKTNHWPSHSPVVHSPPFFLATVTRTKASAPPTENEMLDLTVAIEQLGENVHELKEEVRVLRQVLDEIRDDIGWAMNNREEFRCQRSERPIMHVTSMPKDPLAPDFGERINRLSARDLPASDDDSHARDAGGEENPQGTLW